MADLVDTNILVYSYDSRDPAKRRTADELLYEGLRRGTIRLAHQALVEFLAVVIRPLPGGQPLLTPGEARREVEELMMQFPVLYPNEALVRTALRGTASYGFSWFDAHMWAYAEHYGLDRLLTEDFTHGRIYGAVRIVNPFV